MVDGEGILGNLSELRDTVNVQRGFKSGLLLGLAFGGNVLTRLDKSLDINNQVDEVLSLQVSKEGLDGFNNLLSINNATIEVVEINLGDVQVSLDTAGVQEGLDFFNKTESVDDDFINGSLFLVNIDEGLDVFVNLLGGAETGDDLGGINSF